MRGRAAAVGAVALLALGACANPAATRDPTPEAAPRLTSAPALSPTPVPTVRSPRPDTLHFSVLGDVGATADSRRVLSAVGAAGDAFTLVVGDLSYGAAGAEPAWCDTVKQAVGPHHPVELVAGNHEDHGPNGDIDAFRACLPNRLPGLVGRYGQEWYVDVPAVHPLVRVVMISPALDFGAGEWSYAAGTSHFTWTRDALRSARAAGIPWVVVGMHKPCLSVGVYACDPGADLMNLLLREKADLVVTGHEHMYQRTKRLALGPSCPAVVPGRYDSGCVTGSGGTTFVTVGTGGHELRDVGRSDSEAGYFAAVSARNKDAAFGYLAVDATSRTLDARFRPAAGSTFTDRVSLTR
ncbi:metallophosphoesterase [Phycicoccus sonneratiae]|uniref:Metallophosphoesterase n=1 Tax=Phycicoccus sonneratiae TaxID=2807628 RepID=A0ABS2CK93_9MICO|nr:metallophosphoesterase [Phycicoccus sonneraticus]MBM6399566.1 metallophosphoesterase [Phycicoccus sonneraticus]